MISFSLHEKVECTDGPDGELAAIVIHPQRREVTHLVVRYRDERRLVPIAYFARTDGRTIRLLCSDAEIQHMERFTEERLVHAQPPEMPRVMAHQQPVEMLVGQPSDALPAEETGILPLVIEHVPDGARAIHRGALVEATDGPIGHVSELQVSPKDNHITRLVTQAGNFFRKRELSFPSIAVDHFEDHAVYLRWDKQTIEQLPHSQS